MSLAVALSVVYPVLLWNRNSLPRVTRSRVTRLIGLLYSMVLPAILSKPVPSVISILLCHVTRSMIDQVTALPLASIWLRSVTNDTLSAACWNLFNGIKCHTPSA